MGKKNNKSGAQPMSPEKYIKEKVRMLPLGKCYTYANWKDADEIMVIVTRIPPKGNCNMCGFLHRQVVQGSDRNQIFLQRITQKVGRNC